MSKRTIVPLVVLAFVAGAFLAGAFLAGNQVCAATNEEGIFDRVLGSIHDARGAFRVTKVGDAAAARAAAAEKMRTLGVFLDAAGPNGRAWKEYLLWDRLAEQLTGESAADATELATLLDRFTREHAGLELPAIMQLRTALRQYYYQTLAVDNDRLPAEYEQRLDQLAELVNSLRANSDSESLQKIAIQLAWLEQQQQVPAVVAAVRDLAPVANVHLTVSQEFIAKTTREAVDRVDPLTDVVLGTTVHGTSHLVGTMAAFPVASDGQVRLEARLQGDADTQGRGSNGPVRANVVGSATVQATGDILFGPHGFRVGPTSAQVSATGRPTSLWTTCNSRIADRVVTCVARRRAARTQQLGDCIASRHAEQRMQQQVGEELQTRLRDLQRGYLDQFRNPLLRHDTFPRLFQANSQADRARVEMLLASPTQTGALHVPPNRSAPADLHAQIHETAINNLASSLLAGRTVSETELREFLGQLFENELEKPQGGDSDAIQIVLSDQRPLTFQVDAAMITVKIRADRFIRNRTRYPAMNMLIRYTVQQDARDVLATQAGEPEVEPQDFEETGRRRLGAREVAARRLITSMLDRQLAKSYRLGTFTLPEPADVYGKLTVTQLVADQGWLDIGAEGVE